MDFCGHVLALQEQQLITTAAALLADCIPAALLVTQK